MFVVRIFFQSIFQRIPDSLAHLRSCRIRKCHDQKTVNVHRVLFVRNDLYDTFHEHRRLTGTCCRGN